MKYNVLIFTLSIMLFCSCDKQTIQDLELIVENETIINKGIGDTCVNIVKFSVQNNSDKTYYINNLDNYKLKNNRGVFLNGISILIYDQNDREVKYISGYFKKENAECVYDILMDNADIYEKKLGYKNTVSYFRNFGFKNFFIHPKETIYFEYPIDLSGSLGYEAVRFGYADLNKNKKYYAKISLASDSTTYKTSLPRDILKTIKANKAKVFSGRIESAKIPIEFVK